MKVHLVNFEWNLDEKKKMNNKPTKPEPREDHDGMEKTRSEIIFIHLQDEMMQKFKLKCNGEVQLNGLKMVSPWWR